MMDGEVRKCVQCNIMTMNECIKNQNECMNGTRHCAEASYTPSNSYQHLLLF